MKSLSELIIGITNNMTRNTFRQVFFHDQEKQWTQEGPLRKTMFKSITCFGFEIWPFTTTFYTFTSARIRSQYKLVVSNTKPPVSQRAIALVNGVKGLTEVRLYFVILSNILGRNGKDCHWSEVCGNIPRALFNWNHFSLLAT